MRLIGVGAHERTQNRHDGKPMLRKRLSCWDVCDHDCRLCERYTAMASGGGRDSPDLVAVLPPIAVR